MMPPIMNARIVMAAQPDAAATSPTEENIPEPITVPTPNETTAPNPSFLFSSPGFPFPCSFPLSIKGPPCHVLFLTESRDARFLFLNLIKHHDIDILSI